MKEGLLLAGDVGGTKTILAVCSPEQGPHQPLVKSTYFSLQYPSLEEMLLEFLAQASYTVTRACLGMAGPVVRGRVVGTNLPWVTDEQRLQQALDLADVRLLNDLASIAYGVPWLEVEDVHTLNPGHPEPHGNMAIIAPGTGLGEAFLTWDDEHYRVHASEAGHTDFAPGNILELDLLRYLMGLFGHVSYERVCSGKGIPNIYAYLKDSGYAEEPAWLAEQLAGAEDPTPIIVRGALNKEPDCELCRQTMETFISILGAEAGNMALTVLATSGIYLGGGIPPRILPLLREEHFMRAFRHKGRLSDLLDPIPVHVILNPEVALFGAAAYGLEQ